MKAILLTRYSNNEKILLMTDQIVYINQPSDKYKESAVVQLENHGYIEVVESVEDIYVEINR